MSNNNPNYIAKQYFDPRKGRFLNNQYNEASSESDEEDEQTEQLKYKDVSHYLVVNSADRNWEDNFGQNQYNFKLNFALISDQKVRKPIYTNNPTIPATNTQAMNGNRGNPNTSGFLYNGKIYYPYNPSYPLGEIIGYEDIIEKSVRGANVKKLYKNIISIEIKNVLIPGHSKVITYTNSTHNLNIDSHLILTIPEIQETIEGTSFETSRSFGILIPYTTNYDSVPNDLKWYEYQSINGVSKIYYPTPLNTLPTLTFQLRNSLGFILDDFDDFLDVKYIFREIEDTDDDRTDFLWIETLKFFDSRNFIIGDKIIFRNYQYYNTDTDNSKHFNSFINRLEGHIILEVASSGNQYLKNRIKISRPAKYNYNNGYLDEESWFTSFKTLELADISQIEERENFEYDTGRLLNLNLQITYVLKITTKEYNLDFLADTIKLQG